LELDINKLGRTIDVDIPSPTGVLVPLEFTKPDAVQTFGGDLAISIAGFTSLKGKYPFELDTATAGTTKVRVAGTNISALLGSDPDGVIGTADDVGAKITDGRIGAVLYKTSAGTSYALDAAGTAALVGVPGFTLSGSLAARVNTTGGAVNESITMPSGSPVSVIFAADDTAPVFKGSVTANASGFASISGGFVVSRSTDRLTVAAAGVSAFVGAAGTGLQVSNGKLGVIVNTAASKYALVASGNLALTGITGLTLAGSGAVRINQLDEAINQTITTPAGDVTLDFATADDVLTLSGSASLTVAGFVDLAATLNVEKTTSGDLTSLTVQASSVTAFLGAGAGTTDPADDMGVRLSGGAMDLRLQKNTATGDSAYAFAARGTAALVGLNGLSASGTLVAQRSTMPTDTVLTFGNSDTSDDVTVASGDTRFGGSINVAIAGFTTVAGNFGFEKSVSGSTTKIKLAATDVSAFLGSNPDNLPGTGDEVGAQITGARLGAVLYQTPAGNSYAFDADGNAALVGITGLTVSGSLAARVNTTGAAVNETIAMPTGAPVSLIFAADDTAPVFKGTVTVNASGFATLTGGFAVSKAGDRLKVAVAGVTAFVGAGDTGLRLTGGNLGMIVSTTSKNYALVAGGSIALEGITGFSVGGSAAVRINTLGETVSETISTPAGDVTLNFPTTTEILQVSGSVSLNISDYVDASAKITVKKETAGDLTHLKVTASDVTAFLGVGASTASTSDDMGVRLTSGALDLRWTKDTAANTSYYALGARGTAALVGINGLILTGSLQAERNTGPNSVTLDFGTTSTTDDLTLEPGAKRFGGTAELAISGFVSISGSFGFEESTETIGGTETTRIKVAAAGIQTFLGSGGTGVRLSDGQIGAVIDKPVGGEAKYAVVASGTAALVGIPGLTLNGTMNARINRLGAAINTVISTPAGPVQVRFDDGTNVTQFGGSARLAIGGFVELTGSFGIEKQGETL
ncbi:MAG: beta strand repeat-containing protein, partial [Planctomyces sp.]